MSINIKNINYDKKGKQILKHNPFFTDFLNLMRNTEFTYFYKKYFNNWSDIETMIFYMKLYKFIEQEYINRYSKQITDNMMTFMLDYVIKNNKLRTSAINSFKNFKDNKSHFIKIKDIESDFINLLDFEVYKDNIE